MSCREWSLRPLVEHDRGSAVMQSKAVVVLQDLRTIQSFLFGKHRNHIVVPRLPGGIALPGTTGYR